MCGYELPKHSDICPDGALIDEFFASNRRRAEIHLEFHEPFELELHPGTSARYSVKVSSGLLRIDRIFVRPFDKGVVRVRGGRGEWTSSFPIEWFGGVGEGGTLGQPSPFRRVIELGHAFEIEVENRDFRDWRAIGVLYGRRVL